MKKKLFVSALLSMLVLKGQAQVYPGDTWAQLPVMDLYGNTLNPNTARMMAEADARREQMFEYYEEEAEKAIAASNWEKAITYVDWALDTGYYNSHVYFLKGFAYEKKGDLFKAKRFYRKAKRKGSLQAERALDRLKEEAKRKRMK